MIVAHVGGVPVEEVLAPILATGSGFLIALRAAYRRSQREP